MDELSATTKHIATSKEKIDSILGITGGKSVDDFLNDLSIDSTKIQDAIENIDDAVKTGLSQIDDKALEITSNGSSSMSLLQLKDIELSLKEIEDMISLSK